jgi:hypothetical protein
MGDFKLNSRDATEKLKAEGTDINSKTLYSMMHSGAAPMPAFPKNMATNHKQLETQTVNTPKLEGETEEQYIERLTEEYKKKINDATPPALVARAVSFIQAMASKVFEKPASEEMQAARLNTCYECVHFLLSLENPEQIGHCKACGCQVNAMTSLAAKSKILKSSCPKNLWLDVTIDPAAVALPIADPPA